MHISKIIIKIYLQYFYKFIHIRFFPENLSRHNHNFNYNKMYRLVVHHNNSPTALITAVQKFTGNRKDWKNRTYI